MTSNSPTNLTDGFVWWQVLILLVFCTFFPTASAAQSLHELIEEMKVVGHDPLTKAELPGATPYPVQGTPGDGRSDKVQYYIDIEWPDFESVENREDVMTLIANARFGIAIDRAQDGTPHFMESRDVDVVSSAVVEHPDALDYQIGERIIEGGGRVQLIGEIDLSFDITERMNLAYWTAVWFDGFMGPRFYTEITAGNPVLTITSTVTTLGSLGGAEGPAAYVTSTVSGRTGMAFGPDFRTLSGRGPLNYEEFDIETRRDGCRINKKTNDGSWQVREVVFPTSWYESVSSSGGLDTPQAPRDMPPPLEAVIMIEPSIRESATIRCPRGIPPIYPYPMLIHYFSVFHSFHGGGMDELLVEGESVENNNTLDERRGGLVISGWRPGTGNIIGTRSFERQGHSDDDVFHEKTELVLKWP